MQEARYEMHNGSNPGQRIYCFQWESQTATEITVSTWKADTAGRRASTAPVNHCTNDDTLQRPAESLKLCSGGATAYAMSGSRDTEPLRRPLWMTLSCSTDAR